MKATRLLASFFLLLACAGCDQRGWQSALDPHSNDAGRLASLMRDFTIVCVVVWVLVMVVLILTLFRSRTVLVAAVQPDAISQKRSTVIVSAAVGATVIVITGLTLLSYVTTRGLTADKPGARRCVCAATNGGGSSHISTAGQTKSSPRPTNSTSLLAGACASYSTRRTSFTPSGFQALREKDLIPGRDNEITIEADRPGTYRGQCAEYCGLQHAHMAFLVVADLPDAFAAWQDAQRKLVVEPVGDDATKGLRLFLQKPCAACHTIRGTPASGTLGPDLTHVASRQFIAAGELPTTRGSLAAWIADPQTIKPGNNMPMVPLSGDELLDVSAYLASLR